MSQHSDQSKIADLRKEYQQASLDIESTDLNPTSQFGKWFEEAQNANLNEPNAMVLATSNGEGMVTQRTVLLKAFDGGGFVFYTNYSSKKAQQINENPQVSLLFPWYPLERQVIIYGKAEKISTKESFRYFTSRPQGSQLGAWVSDQSSVISSRKILEMKLKEMKRKFADGKIPIPDFWGGYRIIPHAIEFWQGRPSRLHDRIFYEKAENQWTKKRLSP